MIYADYNATTPMSVTAHQWVRRALEIWGNPSSSHAMGRQAKEIIEESRVALAQSLGCDPLEIVFTSGGSEANTLALLGSYWLSPKDFCLLTTGVEHSSVRDTVGLLVQLGAKIHHLPVLPRGEIDLVQVEKKVLELKPSLVSIMAANNETGVLFPISEIAEICKKAGVVFHTDAVQAYGKVPPNQFMRADLVSVSGHKIYGPKGAGALVVRKGKKLIATHYGGSQEIKRRGGTENPIGICGFGGASTVLPTEDALEKLRNLRDGFETRIREELGDVIFHGQEVARIPNTSSLRFPGIRSEVLLSAFDLDGLYISAGSACSSGSISPSHVLLEMGLTRDEAREALRFSFSTLTTEEEMSKLIDTVVSHVRRIRARRHGGKV